RIRRAVRSCQPAMCANRSWYVQPAPVGSSILARPTRRTASRKLRQPSSTCASSSLEVPGVVVLAIRLLQDLDLLAHGGHRARALDERGHQLAVQLRLCAQTVHRLAPPARVPLRPRLVDPRDLLALDLGIDREDGAL